MKKGFYLLFLSFFLSAVIAKATPVITTNLPASTHACSAATVYYIAHLNDTPTSIVWQVSVNNGTSWSSITTGGPYSFIGSDSLKIVTTAALSGHQYRFIATDSGSITSAVALLTIDSAIRKPITGLSAVCTSQSITLSDSLSGGVWSAVNAKASITSSTGVVTGITAGTDTVIYKYVGTCNTVADTAIITVNAGASAGIITGAAPVCANSTIALADTATGGTWISVNPVVATVDPATGLVSGLTQGFDSIKYVVTAGSSCFYSTSAVIRVDTTVTSFPITGPYKTCIGSSIHLMNENVYGTGIWSTSNGNVSVNTAGIVTGVAGGQDTVTYTFTNSCNSVSSTDTVFVDTVIGHGVISGPATVCAGSEISLSETTPGGIWISGNSDQAVVDADGYVTGLSQGVVPISYYFSNACGASVATYSVTVIDGAVAITGNDSVGVGLTLLLTEATPGGTWSTTSNTFATVNAAGTVTGRVAGTDTVIYTVTNSCGTSSAFFSLLVGHAPSAGVIFGADSLCKGNHVTFADTLVGNGVWSAQNAHATVTNEGIVTGVTYGKDTIYYTYANAFGTTKASKTIFVNAPPVDSIVYPVSFGLGDVFVLGGYPDGGVWTATNDSVAALVSNNLIVLKGGKDTIIYTVTNTCGVTSDYFIVDAPIVSIVPSVSAEDAKLILYPNPAHSNFTFNLQSNANETVEVVISNIVGEKVKALTLITNTATNITLDQPSGIYLLSATTPNGVYTARINIIK